MHAASLFIFCLLCLAAVQDTVYFCLQWFTTEMKCTYMYCNSIVGKDEDVILDERMMLYVHKACKNCL